MHDSRLAASASTGPRIYLELTRQKLSRARRVKNYHVKQPAGPWLAEGSPFEPRYLFRFPRFFLFPRLSPPSLAPLSFAAGQFSPTKVAIRARVRVLRLVSARRGVEGVASRLHPSKRHRLINRPLLLLLLPSCRSLSRFKDLDSGYRRMGKKSTSLNPDKI